MLIVHGQTSVPSFIFNLKWGFYVKKLKLLLLHGNTVLVAGVLYRYKNVCVKRMIP